MTLPISRDWISAQKPWQGQGLALLASRSARFLRVAIWMLCAGAIGCGGSSTPSSPPPASPLSKVPSAAKTGGDKAGTATKTRPNEKPLQTRARFRERAGAAGIQFAYRDGQESNRFAILESLGGGVALGDFDCDGLNDLYFAGGGRFTEEFLPVGYPGALFRNRGAWNFREATAAA